MIEPKVLTAEEFLALDFAGRRNHLLELIEYDYEVTQTERAGRWMQERWGVIPAAAMNVLLDEKHVELDYVVQDSDGTTETRVLIDMPIDVHCGSAFCFAGNAAIAAGRKLVVPAWLLNGPLLHALKNDAAYQSAYTIGVENCLDPDSGRTVEISDTGRELLGLDRNAAAALFNGTNSLPLMQELVYEINRGDGSLVEHNWCFDCDRLISGDAGACDCDEPCTVHWEDQQ